MGWGGRAHLLEKVFPATICCCNGRSHGAGSGSAPHDTVRTFFLPPHPLFFSPSFCCRCFSTGSCFSGKLSTVSPINYVYLCCLLLHAFFGPVRVPDLLCNMACKYPRIRVILVSFASVCDNQRMVSSGVFAQVWYFCVIGLNCPQHCTFIHCRCIFWKLLNCSTLQADALSC